jgi:hypothetical protein
MTRQRAECRGIARVELLDRVLERHVVAEQCRVLGRVRGAAQRPQQADLVRGALLGQIGSSASASALATKQVRSLSRTPPPTRDRW